MARATKGMKAIPAELRPLRKQAVSLIQAATNCTPLLALQLETAQSLRDAWTELLRDCPLKRNGQSRTSRIELAASVFTTAIDAVAEFKKLPKVSPAVLQAERDQFSLEIKAFRQTLASKRAFLRADMATALKEALDFAYIQNEVDAMQAQQRPDPALPSHINEPNALDNYVHARIAEAIKGAYKKPLEEINAVISSVVTGRPIRSRESVKHASRKITGNKSSLRAPRLRPR